MLKEPFADWDPEVLIIFICDRYRAYQCRAEDYPNVLLAFCWAHVRRDFLEGAKARPELENWMHTWVEALGELYHLNAQRLEVWDETLPLAEPSPQFQAQHQALVDRLAAMLFSILQTIVLWGINPRHWLQALLTACAENGGQPLTDLTPFLPWTINETRREALRQPPPLTAPEARVSRPPDTS